MTIYVREFQPADREFILSLVPRFSEFDLPAWRTSEEIDDTNHLALQKAMDQPEPDSVIFVAENEAKTLLGFIRLQTVTDFFSGKQHGYISDVAVAKAREGQGVGRILMKTAETWARDLGYENLTLFVFADNKRAQSIYEKAGFGQDIVRYFKPLNS